MGEFTPDHWQMTLLELIAIPEVRQSQELFIPTRRSSNALEPQVDR